MTQTSTPEPVMTAMVVNHMHGQPTLHRVPMTTVELAREEFGPTLADAKAFVLDVCCTGCGYAASEVRTCDECGVQGCPCLVTEDVEHGTGTYCPEDTRTCYGRCCHED